MSDRLITIRANSGYVDTILALAERHNALDCQVYSLDDNKDSRTIHLLAHSEDRQALLDELQSILSPSEDWHITILPVEATIPRHEDEETRIDKQTRSRIVGESREELYNDVSQNARLDRNFFLFATLSVVVAAIGLIEDNVAVVIGAMVIAPLLGPNLAFALGVALGDKKLMSRATITNFVGVALTLAICALIATIWPLELQSRELMARTDVGFGGIALALASGAAAALSLTTGVSSALVGVMVAVALLPPAATMGLMS